VYAFIKRADPCRAVVHIHDCDTHYTVPYPNLASSGRPDVAITFYLYHYAHRIQHKTLWENSKENDYRATLGSIVQSLAIHHTDAQSLLRSQLNKRVRESGGNGCRLANSWSGVNAVVAACSSR